MSVQEIKIQLDNTYMNVIQFGTGPKPMVMISGVTLSGLEGQGEAVAAGCQTFSDEFTVYLFERRKEIKKGFTVFDMADDIVYCMNQLNIDSAYVYGASQGGMIGQAIAIKYPEKVKNLAVCSTMCKPTETLKTVGKDWLELAGQHDVVELNRYFFKVVYSPAFLESVKDLIPTLEKVGTASDCDRFTVLVEACMSFDVQERLSQIQCPVLVLGDKNDQTLGVQGSMDIINTIHCSNHIYDKYSHAVYDEEPDVKERVKQFFN